VNESRTARFERIRTGLGPALTRVVASYARPGADHDDLAQEVALAVWNALPTFRGDCSERAFVLRVAHNRGMHHLFRRRPPGDDAELDQRADPGPGPDVSASQRQEVERLFASIRRLAPAQRQVLTLALEELPHAEISQVLGLSVSNVAVRLSRARAALRSALEEP
jgi:RNA polymerase sigma factor (sigma-70 family)